MAKKKALVIDEEDFPSNSEASRVAPIREEKVNPEKIREIVVDEESKKVSRLPRGRVVQKKKTFVQSVAETLVGNGSDNIGSYILYEVLLPAAKNTIKEMVTSGIEILLGESTSRSSSKRPDKERSSISYGSFYKRRDEEHRRPVSRRDRFGINDIYFKEHADAEEILDRMCERLEEYEFVSVAEYFDMANIDGATWAHDKYGWTSLKRAYLTHTRHGYAIVLPEPEELE